MLRQVLSPTTRAGVRHCERRRHDLAARCPALPWRPHDEPRHSAPISQRVLKGMLVSGDAKTTGSTPQKVKSYLPLGQHAVDQDVKTHREYAWLPVQSRRFASVTCKTAVSLLSISHMLQTVAQAAAKCAHPAICASTQHDVLPTVILANADFRIWDSPGVCRNDGQLAPETTPTAATSKSGAHLPVP